MSACPAQRPSIPSIMQLVNATPVPADLSVSHIDGLDHRIGVLTAKATFRFEPGRTELDTQAPLPIFAEDQPTDLGLLPADLVPRRDDAFEVILLGATHAPEGETVTEQRVRLQVGTACRELAVFGDRRWDRGGASPVISDPLPFRRLPLTWERAHGGCCAVEIDRDAFIEVSDPLNPLGRGFDAARYAAIYADGLGCPEGYPKLDDQRRLPNLEDPACRIQHWDDAPEPVCWATVPVGLPVQYLETLRRLAEAADSGTGTDEAPGEKAARLAAAGMPIPVAEMLHRAHPSWIIDPPSAGAEIELAGLSPSGGLHFPLPPLRILGDFSLGRRSGTTELVPQQLVLLPEDRRLCLIYRKLFGVAYEPTTPRSMRLRIEEGWCADRTDTTAKEGD